MTCDSGALNPRIESVPLKRLPIDRTLAGKKLFVRSSLISTNWPVLILVISCAGNGSVAGDRLKYQVGQEAVHLAVVVHGHAAECIVPELMHRSEEVLTKGTPLDGCGAASLHWDQSGLPRLFHRWGWKMVISCAWGSGQWKTVWRLRW
jgi:hypothetical protein